METNIPSSTTDSVSSAQKEWTTPELEQLNIAEDTLNNIGSFPDGPTDS